MCGRFVRGGDSTDYAEVMGVAVVPPAPVSYNVAPTQPVLAARVQDGRRAATFFCWGLVPFWSKDGRAFINARAETVADKPAFKAAFKYRRCLIPADGYYEWKANGKHKRPYYFRLRDGRPFVFAGLWDTWQDVETCAIITTEANDLQKPVHDRMPLIVPWEFRDVWLDPAVEPAALKSLLRPYPAEAMTCHPVSTLVNSPRNDDPRCIEPAA
jgi:putative SOS response-associated peptidase YedK